MPTYRTAYVCVSLEELLPRERFHCSRPLCIVAGERNAAQYTRLRVVCLSPCKSNKLQMISSRWLR